MIEAVGVDEVTDSDFAEVVLRSSLPVLVKFTADWCPPCRQLGPVLSAIAAEEGERLSVVQIDVDTSPETAIAYGVLATPTLIVFRDGEPVKSMTGARPKRRLLQELADVL